MTGSCITQGHAHMYPIEADLDVPIELDNFDRFPEIIQAMYNVLCKAHPSRKFTIKFIENDERKTPIKARISTPGCRPFEFYCIKKLIGHIYKFHLPCVRMIYTQGETWVVGMSVLPYIKHGIGVNLRFFSSTTIPPLLVLRKLLQGCIPLLNVNEIRDIILAINMTIPEDRVEIHSRLINRAKKCHPATYEFKYPCCLSYWKNQGHENTCYVRRPQSVTIEKCYGNLFQSIQEYYVKLNCLDKDKKF